MAETKQAPAITMQKGSYIIIEGVASKVVTTATSKPGKHGSSKIRIDAVGLIDGKKRGIVMPGHDNVDVPVIEKKNAQVLSINGGMANVMDSQSYETFDIEIAEELKADIKEGSEILYWEILNTKVMKQVK
jgi:translation initiation factor 5A